VIPPPPPLSFSPQTHMRGAAFHQDSPLSFSFSTLPNCATRQEKSTAASGLPFFLFLFSFLWTACNSDIPGLLSSPLSPRADHARKKKPGSSSPSFSSLPRKHDVRTGQRTSGFRAFPFLPLFPFPLVGGRSEEERIINACSRLKSFSPFPLFPSSNPRLELAGEENAGLEDHVRFSSLFFFLFFSYPREYTQH